MGHDEYVRGQHRRILELAQALLKREIDQFEGCSEIARLAFGTDLEDAPGMLTFVAIEDDADEWPSGKALKLASPEYLARVEQEKAEWLPKVQDAIDKACRDILEHLSD